MRRLRQTATLAFALGLSAPGVAQRGGTVPPGYERGPAPSAVELQQPWGAKSTRFQYRYGSLRQPLMAIRGMGMRRDDSWTANSVARVSHVKIMMGACRDGGQTSRFDANYAAPPTIVFDGPVALPKTDPPAAHWGQINFLPFDALYQHPGQRDLLIELCCRETKPAGRYSLDCVDGDSVGRGTVRYLDIAAGCRDEGGGFDAFFRPPVTDARGRVVFEACAGRAPRRGAAALLWSLTAPVARPSSVCAGLRLGQPELAIPLCTDAEGGVASLAQPLRFCYSVPPSAGLPVVFAQFLALGAAAFPAQRSDAVRLATAAPTAGADVSALYSLQSHRAEEGRLTPYFVPVVLLVYD
ncbi:MAG: hypothetical protein AAF628_24100 [Planctomycetota bacterium]